MDKSSPIGVFDSGVGGLTVLKELVSELNNERFIYFGDTLNVPYGDKTPDELTGIVKKILDWYESLEVKMVIMACNSSSAVCLDRLKDNYKYKIIGIIEPAVKEISKLNCKNIGLIATNATINSNAYFNILNSYNSGINLIQKATPEFVKIIESNQVNSDYARNAVTHNISPLLDQNIEKLILGCTHYPYLAGIIQKLSDKNDFLINPAKFLVDEVKSYLTQHDLNNSSQIILKPIRNDEFYVSGSIDNFKTVSKLFYQCDKIEKIVL